jgi:DNA invertase Pin-like site-specific DNA recombinase
MSVNNRPLRAAIYARISLGTEESVSLDTQLADTRKLAEDNGWQVVREIKDETVSAYKKAPWQRPNLGPWLANPDADVLIGWKLDRVIRRMSDLWQLHQRLTDAGVALATYVDKINMTTTQGQMMASILAGQAQTESENTSLRQTAARARQIDAGRVVGGKRPWPFKPVPNPDGPGKVWRPIPKRMRALRDAAAELTARRTSLLAVCRAWNEDPELRPNSGAAWRVTPLRNLLTNPTIAGATVRHKQQRDPRDRTKWVKTDTDGLLRNADGTIRIDPDRAILSWAEFEALGKALERWSRGHQQRGERALLTGTLHCASCRAPLSPNRSARYHQYKCGNSEVCRAQASVNMAAADKYMTELYLSEYGDRPVLVAREQPADSADVAALKEAISATNAELARIATGDDEESWGRLPELRKQRAELQQRLDGATRSAGAIVLVESGETQAQRWEHASVAERADMIRSAYHVTVRQAGQGKRFSPDNLTVTPWDELTADPAYGETSR